MNEERRPAQGAALTGDQDDRTVPADFERVGNILPRVLDDLLDSGLRHELSWAMVKRLLDQLPGDESCRWCGGAVDPKGHSYDDAWRCRACGRLDLKDAVPMDYPIVAIDSTRELAIDARWPERVLEELRGLDGEHAEEWRRAAHEAIARRGRIVSGREPAA